MIACMGGFCIRRDECFYYHSGGDVVMERLCEPNKTDSFLHLRACTENLPSAHPPRGRRLWPSSSQTRRPATMLASPFD